MLPEYFAIVAVVLSLLGGLSYIIATLKGETKPNRMTWGLLTMFTGIAFFAALDGGAGWATAGVGAGLFNVVLIFAASYVNPKAYWKTEKRDYWFGLIALVGLLLWLITDNPNLAIVFSIVADVSAALPTFIKAYKKPNSENGRSFVVWTVAQGSILLIIDDWTFAAYAFPIYLVMFNGALAYLTVIRPKRLS